MGVELKEQYSFSKLTSFHTCKYSYYQTYLLHKKGVSNPFSSYGLFIHSLMERYAKGELTLDALPQLFCWEFEDNVKEPFPKSPYCSDMKLLYYNQGLSFLKSFTGYEDVRILEIESEFTVDIDDWKFTGIIDLVYIDKNGDLVIRDYKSKASFKSKKELHQYARQLYLYSLYVKEKYGKYPDKLNFLMFRKNESVTIDFNLEDFYEAIEWAKNTVSEIRECWDYSPTCDDFYSKNLCNHREYCEQKRNTNVYRKRTNRKSKG